MGVAFCSIVYCRKGKSCYTLAITHIVYSPFKIVFSKYDFNPCGHMYGECTIASM